MKNMDKKLKALANKRRLAILAFLKSKKSQSVGSIASHIKLTLHATSKHLGILYAQNILEREQVSLTVIYRISDDLDPITKHIISLL